MTKYLIILLFITSVCFAQDLTSFPRNFGHIDYADGLSNNHVLCFAQDNNGFLWIGTSSGLNRYDGYNFKIFKHDPLDSASIPDNVVETLIKDQLGRFWIGLPQQICLFNPNNEEFTNSFSLVCDGESYYEYNIDFVLPYGDSILFLSVPGAGIIEHNIITNINHLLRHDDLDSSSLHSINIRYLALRGDLMYVTHQDGFIDVVNLKTRKVSQRIPEIFRLFAGTIQKYELFPDKNRNLWVFFNDEANGLYRIDSLGRLKVFNTESSPALNSNIISCIIEDSDENIWIGTDHGGINILSPDQKTIEIITHEPYNEKSLSQNVITELYVSTDSLIWIGTFKHGVNFYHKKIYQFLHFVNFPNNKNTLPYNDVNCFAEDQSGNLWIGTNGKGLIYYDRNKNQFQTINAIPGQPDALQSDVIVSLLVDKHNHLWIGTYHGGLSYFNGIKFRNYLHDPNNNQSLNDNKVWEIFEDSHDNLWIGMLGGGLDLFDRKKQVFYHYYSNSINSLNSDFVMDIIEDNEGNIWFGTEVGVFVLDYSTSRIIKFEHEFQNKKSLSDNFVYSVFKDSRGIIWAGTRNGLNYFSKDENCFIPIVTKNSVPDNSIMSILESDDGNLWLGTSNGLTNLVLTFDENSKYQSHYNVVFNESDGLQGREFNEGSAIKTSRGELIFGGSNGFNLFIPETSTYNNRSNRPHIVGLEIFGNEIGINDRINGKEIVHSSILDGSTIELNFKESMFSLKFVLPDYLTAKKIRYRYKLDGFNEQWIYTSWQDRKATFTNLNPGKYVFVVQASDYLSNWNDSESFVNIIILPPWYRTWIAYIAYIIALLGIIYFWINFYADRVRNRNLKEKAAEESTRQHELNALKTKFFTNVSHEFRTPLTLILTPLDNLLRKDLDFDTKKHLSLIRQNAARLLNLVNQLLDFRKAEQSKLELNLIYGNIVNLIRQTVDSFYELTESKNIDLKFLAYNSELFMQFDKDKIEKIINNLISNAIKFTHEGLSIHVVTKLETEFSGEYFVIKVEDKGIGIARDHHEKIFERFYQVNLPREFVKTGSGIGLSLVQEFVELHNGRITVDSEPGKGSCFTIKLPVNRERLRQNEDQDDEVTQIVQDIEKDTKDPGPGTRAKTILLVEDNSEFRGYLKDSLKDKYLIMEAENGQEALDLLDKSHADLIVSDIMMPVMDGIKLCAKIKTDAHFSHIPVILLTAKSTHDDKVTGLKQGADDYITKPFDLDILESRISYLLNLRQKFIREYQKSLRVESNSETITPLDEKLLKSILNLINENINNTSFSVEGLSKKLGMSRVHLYKKTISLIGKTPIELIRLVRLKKAAELLVSSKLTISEITYDVGFSDPRYFSKLFKNEFEVLPSKYRETITGN